MPEDNITVGELLSDELKSNEGLQKFTNSDVNTLATSYLEVESKIGSIKDDVKKEYEGMVKIPDANSDDNARREFFTKLGCPQKIEDYPSVEIEGLPEESEQDKKFLEIVRNACHRVGVTKEQYQEVMTDIVKNQLVSLDNFVKMDKQAEKETLEKLDGEWGGEAKRKERVELSKRLIAKYNSEDSKALEEFLIDTRLGSYAPLVKLLGNIAADIIKEDVSGVVGESTNEPKVERSPTTGEVILTYDKSPELN